jgi:gluconate 2-dehydrogenase gamma chain
LVDQSACGEEAQPERSGPFVRHTRRELLQYGAAVAGAVALPVLDASTASAKGSTPVSLTSQEMTTLKAALARMLPNDDLGPGAIEADVHVYIDRALAGSYKPARPLYTQLLSTFDKAAASTGATSFSALSASSQDSVLMQVEAGTAPGVPASDQAAAMANFQLLLSHMREGMFADPMYGGNRDLAGWQLIGYPGVTLVWSANDQTVGAKVPPSHDTATTYGGRPYNGPPANL